MTSNQTSTLSELPPETVDFAHRMFDAARKGDADLLLAAVDAGLPPNLSNQNGTSNLHPVFYIFTCVSDPTCSAGQGTRY